MLRGTVGSVYALTRLAQAASSCCKRLPQIIMRSVFLPLGQTRACDSLQSVSACSKKSGIAVDLEKIPTFSHDAVPWDICPTPADSLFGNVYACMLSPRSILVKRCRLNSLRPTSAWCLTDSWFARKSSNFIVSII